MQTISPPISSPDWDALIVEADSLLRTLFPLCRSLTGAGLRHSLDVLREVADFQVCEVASGTRCYDWTIPDEWNVSDAYVADSSGHRVIDFRENNLHLVGYSIPFEGEMSLAELAPHLFTLPEMPSAIPYRTSYYQPSWGFCLAHEQFVKLDRNEHYRVVVDTQLGPGSMTYGQALLPGGSGQEFLLSTYLCHPSLANDNLSGAVLWTLLLRELHRRPRRHSYRCVIAPETIGALAYIARNEAAVRKLKGGFVVTTVAGPGRIGYKRSWCGNSLIDRAVRLTFRELGLEPLEYPFDARGSDERQYSSPGLRIPVGTICKDKYYEYDAYHTSLDNLDFVQAAALVETLKVYLAVIEKFERDRTYRSLNPIGEPQLGKRGLYPQLGGALHQKGAGGQASPDRLEADRWLLFYGDGQTSLLSIAEKTGLPMDLLAQAAEQLAAAGLLEEVV
jgi:aminopeptidase-like protein